MNAATLSRHNRIGHTLTSASANDVCRKDRRDGLTVNRRLESPAKKMALVADVFIVAPDVRMSILAVGSPMRPYTLTQTDQNTSRSPLQTGRAIRFPCHAVSREEAMKDRHRDVQAKLDRARAQFFKRDVLARLQARAHVAALRFGCKAAGLAPLRKPSDRRLGRDSKPGHRRTATHHAINHSSNDS